MSKLLRLIPALALLCACASAPPKKPAPVEAPPVLSAEVLTAGEDPDELRALDVGVVLFDPGIPKDEGSHTKLGIFPGIRRAEARYLPYALRQTLVDTNLWGAVRVLPKDAPESELLVEGKILASDGVTLKLQITATDSSGKQWVNKVYSESAVAEDYTASSKAARRPFQDLYNQIANDLYTARQGLQEAELLQLGYLSELRYAAELAPDAFGGHVQAMPDQRYALMRLPAQGDPMLARIDRIRQQEYLFIDTVDEEYALLYADMTPTYDLWRQFNREQTLYRSAQQERIAERKKPKGGSYQAMKLSYNNFRWVKMQQQELRELAQGFHNEVEPTVMTIEGRVVKLSGSLDERYSEWRKLLQKIYAIETGTGN
jgi:hypothetical protein